MPSPLILVARLIQVLDRENVDVDSPINLSGRNLQVVALALNLRRHDPKTVLQGLEPLKRAGLLSIYGANGRIFLELLPKGRPGNLPPEADKPEVLQGKLAEMTEQLAALRQAKAEADKRVDELMAVLAAHDSPDSVLTMADWVIAQPSELLPPMYRMLARLDFQPLLKINFVQLGEVVGMLNADARDLSFIMYGKGLIITTIHSRSARDFRITPLGRRALAEMAGRLGDQAAELRQAALYERY